MHHEERPRSKPEETTFQRHATANLRDLPALYAADALFAKASHAAWLLFKDPVTRPRARFPLHSVKWVRLLGAKTVADPLPPDT